MQKQRTPLWINKYIKTEEDEKTVLSKLGNSYVKRILDPDLKNKFENALYNLWNNRPNGFPGNLALSVMTDDLKNIQQIPHIYFTKSNGIRYMLFFYSLKNINNEWTNYTLLYERTGHFYIVHDICMTNCDKIYDGSLFDGELVQYNDGKYVFQIFDCLIIDGDLLINKPITIRLKEAEILFTEKYYQYKESNPFSIDVKNSLTADVIISILNDNSILPYPTDGIILMKKNCPYYPGRDVKYKSILKYKLPSNHTVDFIFNIDKEDKWKATLKVLGENRNYEIIICTIKLNDDDLRILNIAHPEILDKQIIECQYNHNNVSWHPIKIRYDKEVPNNINTYNITMKNIIQNITLEEFIQYIK